MDKNEKQDFNEKDDFIEKQDIRDRKFGEVQLPKPPKQITNRRPPTAKDLGPLANLLGVWHAEGTGWNMIALPFQGKPGFPAPFKFRLLMNQYDEELKFVFIDDKVPNRGLKRTDDPDEDQFTVTIDYQQKIAQIHAEDRPNSGGLAGLPKLPIHHEPGLWLYQKNRPTKDDRIIEDVVDKVVLDVARLASIPHGNSVLALGTSQVHKGMPEIPPLSGLPSGRFENVLTPDYDFRGLDADPYLEPYKHYIQNPYKGVMGPAFPGFSPADMNDLLRLANKGVKIRKTTTLTVDTDLQKAGITNIPFSVREAEPVSMKSTFWIQELEEKDASGNHKLRLQYSQVVMLHFFHPRQDQFPGRAVWPHISIATLEKDPAGYKIVSG